MRPSAQIGGCRRFELVLVQGLASWHIVSTEFVATVARIDRGWNRALGRECATNMEVTCS